MWSCCGLLDQHHCETLHMVFYSVMWNTLWNSLSYLILLAPTFLRSCDLQLKCNMFAVNGPTGPTSRHERRVRDDKQTKEQLDAQRALRESFFKEKSKSSASSDAKKSTSTEAGSGKENDAPQIFKGCRIYFNGRTGNISSYYLTKLVQQHGGNMAREYKVTRVTHIVACNLSGSKADKLIKSCGKIKCVRPEWILQSVKQGKKLPEFDFLVYKDASSGVMATAFTSKHTAAKPPARP